MTEFLIPKKCDLDEITSLDVKHSGDIADSNIYNVFPVGLQNTITSV